MAIMLERTIVPKSSVLLCVFLWAKGLSAKDIQKEIFRVCVGKCLFLKAIHNWADERGKISADDEVETAVWDPLALIQAPDNRTSVLHC
jgi:hypothetical protein